MPYQAFQLFLIRNVTTTSLIGPKKVVENVGYVFYLDAA